MNSSDKEILIRETANIKKPGLTRDELMATYEGWQASGLSYDQVQEIGQYNGPRKTAECAARHVQETDRENFRILDVGAGTGLVAQQLDGSGFKLIDALEPSEALLKDAKDKGVYKRIYTCFMTGEVTPEIEADSYDGLVTCGCFMENHLPVKALDEMIRVVKPGGIIVIVTRLIYLKEVSAYNGILEPYMQELEKHGKLEVLSREEFPNYYKDDKGIAWVFRKK